MREALETNGLKSPRDARGLGDYRPKVSKASREEIPIGILGAYPVPGMPNKDGEQDIALNVLGNIDPVKFLGAPNRIP